MSTPHYHPPLLQRLLAPLMANRWVNCHLHSAAGRAFYSKLMYRMLTDAHWAPAVRRALRRNQFWRALLVQPWRRWRFQRQHGFVPPMAVMISPSLRCNLSCKGCFANDWSTSQELPYAAVRDTLVQMDACGTQLFIIGGGEPFSWPHLFTLLEEFPHCGFIIYTNGTLIDDACAARLARTGNMLVAVSIEGFAAEHDARRGTGCHARAMAGLQALHRAGVASAFSVTVMRSNHELVLSDAFVDQFEALHCLMGFYLSYMPVDAAADPEIMPTPEQRAGRRARIAELQRTKRTVVLDFTNDGPLANGCGAAGRMYVHINPQGDIEPCPFCHFATHNLRDTSVIEALHTPFLAAIRTWHATQHDPLLPCPMIDHPDALRTIVAATGARPTHPSAAKMLHEFAPALDAYSAAHARLAVPAGPERHGRA